MSSKSRKERGEVRRSFKVCHQTLCVDSINFAKKSLHGEVELNIVPLRPDLKKVRLNCKQCKLFGVVINDTHEVSLFVVFAVEKVVAQNIYVIMCIL